MIQNGRNLLLGNGTLKPAAYQEWIDVKSWFFACRYKSRKATIYLNNYCVGIVKDGEDFWSWGFKSGVFHKWFDKLSRLIEWYLHADSNGIIFGLIDNLWDLI